MEFQLDSLLHSLPSRTTLVGFVLYEESLHPQNLRFSSTSRSFPCIYVNKEYAQDLSSTYPSNVYYATFTNDIEGQDLWKVTFGMILMILCLAFVFSLCMNYYIYMHHGYNDELPFTNHGNPSLTRFIHVSPHDSSLVDSNGNANGNTNTVSIRKTIHPSLLDQFPTCTFSTKMAAETKMSMKKGFKDLRKKVLVSHHLLSKASLESISSVKTNENLEPCSICLEEYQEGDSIRQLSCHHLFHTECIDKWILKRNATCPLCKFCL